MCLAVPLRIVSIDGATAVCESCGVTRSVRLDFIDTPAVGDYILCHAGFAIEKLDRRMALENLEAIEEMLHAR
jgi:hydrogenase expression/formation protein HypC